jgi:leucyl/phenylalanyl-tRNA--protein transferase
VRRKTIVWLSPADPPDWFPPAEQALDEPPGLLAGGGDLSPARLLAAYERGIFPWYAPDQPLLWWAPDPRMVLFPGEFRRTRSLAKTLRNGGFTVSLDVAFPAVIDACAAPRGDDGGTWITSDMRRAYVELHQLGHAHSVEIWRHGALAGGLYGVRLGSMFFGESMFHRERDASKVAVSHLVDMCLATDIRLIDCQWHTPHLESLGGRTIPRAQFLGLLKDLVHTPGPPLALPP